jgi:serine/threonine-protein kinase
VIHRDIKPENILLHKGRPMVADFGIALAVSAAAGGRMTETGLSLGTPHYMSPEQATAEKDITARSDIYSLGSVLYEMLAGAPPHLGGSAQQIIMKIVTEEAQPVTALRKSVPPHVAAATAKSLEKLAADRFESAAKFAEALANPAFTLPATQAASVAGAPTSGARNRSVVVAWGLAVVFAVLFVLVSVWAATRPQPSRSVSRYSVALAPEIAVGGRTRLALAPDGGLVYLSPGDQGQARQLWLRPRDRLDATPLPGTAAAFMPFFSPDGRRVAFFLNSPRALKTASVSGGPPITVADSGIGLVGGSWGWDGYIYTAAEVRGGVVRVMETGGGALEPVTSLDTTRGELDHWWPEALPNGKGLLFTVVYGNEIEENDIAVVEFATGQHRVMVRGSYPHYAVSGHLAYVTADGTLMVVPFDQDALTVTGDPMAVVEGVRMNFFGGADISLSANGTLAYVTGGPTTSTMMTPVWVERDGGFTPVDANWTLNTIQTGGLALSPDATRMAVNILEDDGGSHIYVKRLPAGLPSKVTFEGRVSRRPVWTSDGQSLVFVSDRAGQDDVWQKRVDGSQSATLLMDEEREVFEGLVSPGGEWVVFRTDDDAATSFGLGDILAIRPGVDSVPIELVATEFEETSPVLSRDGKWLAYASAGTGQKEIYVQPFPGVADGFWQVSVDGGTEPLWSHGGDELFFRDNQGQLVVAGVATTPTFEVRTLTPLFDATPYIANEDHRWYDVSQDGQRFLMLRLFGVGQEADPSELIIVENWFEELKAKVGN